MTSARAAAIVTWVYALGFGLPTVPVSIYVLRTGQLPSFFGLFEMFGGTWSASVSDSTFVVLLLLFGATTLLAVCSAWLLWQGRRIGAVLNLAVLPVEAVFWVGFALPLPWVTGIARVVLIAVAWTSLSRSGRRAELARCTRPSAFSSQRQAAGSVRSSRATTRRRCRAASTHGSGT